MGGHWIEETIRIEDILGEGIQIKMGDPPGRGGPPDRNGGPLIMEDPLMMEDPWEMDDILNTL